MYTENKHLLCIFHFTILKYTSERMNGSLTHNTKRNFILLVLCYHLAALQSVFPQTELGTFMSLVKRDKERQLIELSLIVTGIRLFNRDCGKGGEGIDDGKFYF